MGDITGFLKIKRKEAGNRPVVERIYDFSEIEQILNSEDRMLQASRCMDCGVPFCHWSCPVDNIIPEWNDLLYRGNWRKAYEKLCETNNFPEFTGRICPAPCEHGCVLNLHKEPVTIRENEVAIAEKAFAEGYVKPSPPGFRTGKNVAVIGSGPAGLAAADLLNKAGHEVTLFEKEARAGGLLRYGVPDFKLGKSVIDRRMALMIQEGLILKTNINVGIDITAREIVERFDAVCIATGATCPKDLDIEGRDLEGIFFALDFLISQNKVNSGESNGKEGIINARGRRVLIIGGGDTGSDCVGTAIRQQAAHVTQIEIMPAPPLVRSPDNPWPYYAKTLKTTTSHEEGCERYWALSTVRFVGIDGKLTGAEVDDVEWIRNAEGYTMNIIQGTRRLIETDMILLALGFSGPATDGLLKDFDIQIDTGKNIRPGNGHSANVGKVFIAGDVITGPSLAVNAIASGRKAAMEIDRFLQ